MFKRIAGFCVGYVRVTVPPQCRCCVMALLFRLGMSFFGEKRKKDGTIVFCLPLKALPVFVSAVEEETEGVLISAPVGIPAILRFLLARPGIALGILLFLGWSVFSETIVWDIRIEGNTVTPDSEIIDLLSELGFGYGTRFRGVDFDDLHARFAAKSPSIGWLSIYMDGTVAKVQVRELVRPDRFIAEEGTYANVVAEEDGVIRSVQVEAGAAAVKAGDLVRKGDVLISGVVPMKQDGIPDGGQRFVYAAGEVFAQIACPLEVKIALTREEKVYTGEETHGKSIIFFGNVVKLFKNSGIDGGKYDKIDKIKRLSLFGIHLPVWITDTVCRPYVTEMKQIPAEEATAEAMTELRRRMDEALLGGELDERRMSVSVEDGCVTVRCLLYMTKDIGQTAEFHGEENR